MTRTENLFPLLDELQQVHGLRNDDYVKYRRYCTRKLERLRSKFNLHHTSTSKVEISLELCQKNSEVLHLILFKCEWFLAEINQLRKELSFNSRKKHHLRSICRNSLKYCHNLKQLSQDTFPLGSNLRLEYLAYTNLFEGIVRNELKEYSAAFNLLQRAKVVFEELIQRNFAISVMEVKVNELETVLRVCQYSADMYDAVIELDQEALDEFKMSQLTEKLSSTEIKEATVVNTAKTVETGSGQKYKIGSSTFEMTQELAKFSGKLFSKALKARKTLKKQTPGTPEYKNAHLQVAYFEDRYYGQLIKNIWKSSSYQKDQFKKFKALDILKELARSEGYNADPVVEDEFNRVARIVSYLIEESDAQKVMQNATKAMETIQSSSQGQTYILKMISKRSLRMIDTLREIVHDNKDRLAGYEPSFVPPKPSFYDMAFDCLSYVLDTDVSMANNQKTEPSKGITNLLSSFWGKK